MATIVAAGIVQIGIAVLAVAPPTRTYGGLLFAAICTAYMPLHIWDLFRDDPMIAPLSVAAVRIIVQMFFIWVDFRLWKKMGS